MTNSKEEMSIRETDKNKLVDKTFIIRGEIEKCFPNPGKFKHERTLTVKIDYWKEHNPYPELFERDYDWREDDLSGFIDIGNKSVRGTQYHIVLDNYYLDSTKNIKKFAKYIVGTECILLRHVSPMCQKRSGFYGEHKCGEKNDCVYKSEVVKQKLFLSAYPLLKRFIKDDSRN